MTSRLLLVAMVLIVVACASKEVLQTRSATVPEGIDLSGQWTLRAESDETNRRLEEAELAAAGGKEGILSKRGQSSSDRHSDSLVHVFLETGRKLKISQTFDGLFISFDRAIVEEYRFGEYTRVNVGPVIANRSSGWEAPAYVIETLDKEGNKLYERYELITSEQLLLRQITIYKRGEVALSLVQKFDRVGG